MLKYLCNAAFMLGMLLLGDATGTYAAEERHAVHIRGSTTFLPIAQRIAEAYMNEHPDRAVAISSGGTMRGYKSLIDGTADIALVSGDVPSDLEKEVERRGITLVSMTAGYNAIVPVVHPSNPLVSLSMKQLKNIFSGRTSNWKDVGGKNTPINVYVGPPTGGITDTWKDAILGDDIPFTSKAAVIGADKRIRLVATDQAAITFLTLGEVNASVKALWIDGIAVTPQTVLDGRHPVRTPLMLVTTNKPSAATTEFIQYFTAPRKAFRFAGFVNAAPLASVGK